MALFNCSTEIGAAFCNVATTYTGSYLLAFVLLFIVVIVILLAYGLPLEFALAVEIPLSIACLLVTGNGVLLGISLLYLAFVLAKLFPT